MRKSITLALAMMLCISMITQASAQNGVPQLINYQGYLTDENGKALSDTYDLIFRLYPDTSKTSNWDWSEEQSVMVENGLYNVLLGSINPITADTLKGEKYLGITVQGQTEMKPRLRIASVAYSLRSEQANKATEANYAHVLSAADNDPLEAVVVTNDGRVGIGTDNPQATLDVAGSIFVKGGAPFEFRRYGYQTYSELQEVKSVQLDTGRKKTEWQAAIIGYDAGYGDLSESGNVRLWKIQMVIIDETWHICLDSPTHSAGYPDWIVDVMFIRTNLVNSDY